MQYTYPDYYKEFTCIADKCPDTCCAGWQIVIDDPSLEHYENISDSSIHPFKERLKQSIDWDEQVFKQDECRRCAFLNKQNLCDLYTALGEESLCHTCTTYPRHIEEFEDLREVTLSLSCPEVARMLMGKKEKVTFYDEETSEQENYEEYEDFDGLMFGILQDIRSHIIGIMQDREMSIEARVGMIWLMAEELQDCIDDDVFGCEDILEEYKHPYMYNKIKNNLENPQSDKPCRKKFTNIGYAQALDMFKILYRLEVLDEAWEQQVDETSLTLYGKDEQYYEKLCEEFNRWIDEHMPEWHVQAEQIVVYFISTYLCGAVYDGLVSSKVKMAVASVFFIHEMLMSWWIRQNRKLEFKDVVNVVYRYSRELEHSDINIEEMEACFME